MIKCLLFLFSIAHALVILDDFSAPIISEDYCTVNLTQNHLGWSPRQPPQEWANVTFNAVVNQIQVTQQRKYTAYSTGWYIYKAYPYSMTMFVNYWGAEAILYYVTDPIACKYVNVTVRYGKHV